MNARFSQRLHQAVEQLENLRERIRSLQQEVAEVNKGLRQAGFDLPTIATILKERRMSEEERSARSALLDIYRGALGMLHGTPLGEEARRRLDRKDDPPPPDEGGEGEEESPPEAPATSSIDLDAARQQGRAAAQAGKRVVDNPFPAGDPQRAAWDEGWCEQDGSDGMDIPSALRRKPKPEKPKKETP